MGPRKKKKIFNAASKELEERLEDEDWFIPDDQIPDLAGNHEGYWIEVQFFVKYPTKRKKS